MSPSPSDQRVALVTGASSGIGRACAERLLRLGFKVYAASRSIRPDTIESAACLTMDVDDDRSVSSGIAGIVDENGRIDVVVNSAGSGFGGAVEDTAVAEAKAQFETTFFGVLRVCRGVLPVMRGQGSGLVVNISSLAGLTGIPFQGLYSASKFALEGLTETLRMEVAPFGIDVVLIEPGDFATGFTAKRRRTVATNSLSPYFAACTKALATMEHDEMCGPSPLRVACLLEKIIRTPRPKLRYRVGLFAQTAGILLKNVLPYSLYEKIIMQTYGMGQGKETKS